MHASAPGKPAELEQEVLSVECSAGLLRLQLNGFCFQVASQVARELVLMVMDALEQRERLKSEVQLPS